MISWISYLEYGILFLLMPLWNVLHVLFIQSYFSGNALTEDRHLKNVCFSTLWPLKHRKTETENNHNKPDVMYLLVYVQAEP